MEDGMEIYVVDFDIFDFETEVRNYELNEWCSAV